MADQVTSKDLDALTKRVAALEKSSKDADDTKDLVNTLKAVVLRLDQESKSSIKRLNALEKGAKDADDTKDLVTTLKAVVLRIDGEVKDMQKKLNASQN